MKSGRPCIQIVLVQCRNGYHLPLDLGRICSHPCLKIFPGPSWIHSTQPAKAQQPKHVSAEHVSCSASAPRERRLYIMPVFVYNNAWPIHLRALRRQHVTADERKVLFALVAADPRPNFGRLQRVQIIVSVPKTLKGTASDAISLTENSGDVGITEPNFPKVSQIVFDPLGISGRRDENLHAGVARSFGKKN